MAKIQLNYQAPDFTLPDVNNQPVRLSEFQNQKHVVLIFNRGFI